MTENELLLANNREEGGAPVTVKAADYSYDGWLVSVFPKRSMQMRCVLEDANGRLFIHNARQITERS